MKTESSVGAVGAKDAPVSFRQTRLAFFFGKSGSVGRPRELVLAGI